MKNKKSQLFGKWSCDDEDSDMEMSISLKEKKIFLETIDLKDNEKFKISNIKWNGKGLFYRARIPSTNHKTKSLLIPISNSELREELTVTNIWEKVDFEKSFISNNTDKKINQLLGVWEAEEDFISVNFKIYFKKGKIEIDAFDRLGKEKVEVTDIKWNGKNLYFVSLDSKGFIQTKHLFTSISDTKCEHELTFIYYWDKKHEKKRE